MKIAIFGSRGAVNINRICKYYVGFRAGRPKDRDITYFCGISPNFMQNHKMGDFMELCENGEIP